MSDNKTKVTVCVTAEYDKAKRQIISGDENVKITVGSETVKTPEEAVEIIGKLSAPAGDGAQGANNGDGKNATNPDANASVGVGAQDKSGAKKPVATGNAINPIPPAGDATNPGANNGDGSAGVGAGDLPKINDKFTMTKGPFANQIGTVEEVNEETKTVKLKFDNGQIINQTYDEFKEISEKANNPSGGGRSKAKRRRPKRVGTKKKKHTKRQRKYGSKTKKY